MTITSDKMYYGNYGNTAKKNAIAVIISTYFVRRNAEIGSITPGSIPSSTPPSYNVRFQPTSFYFFCYPFTKFFPSLMR